MGQISSYICLFELVGCRWSLCNLSYWNYQVMVFDGISRTAAEMYFVTTVTEKLGTVKLEVSADWGS